MILSDYSKIKICRLCESNRNLFYIYDRTKNVDITKIQNCANIKIKENDLLPKRICGKCKLKIERIHEFQILCKTTEKKFNATIEHASLQLNTYDIAIKKENELIIEELKFDDNPIKKIDSKQNLEEYQVQLANSTIETTSDQLNIENDDNILKKETGLNKELNLHQTDKIISDAKDNHETNDTVEISNTELTDNTKKKVECNICHKMLSGKRFLRYHLIAHTNAKSYECKTCFKKFNFPANLRRHMKTIHELQRAFVCTLCGKSFTQKVGLQAHESVHLTEKLFKCDICNKHVKTKFLLKIHKKRHSSSYKVYKYPSKASNKIYVCTYCGKQMKNSTAFEAHVRRHTGEKPFECDVCGMKFNHSMTLKLHHSIHTNIKPYKCKECGKSFRQPAHLSLHTKIHSGERPHPCRDCGKSFKAKADLVLHTRRHTGERPFACEHCSMKFIEKRLMQRHVKKIHENCATDDKSI